MKEANEMVKESKGEILEAKVRIEEDMWELRLYVAGQTPNSIKAFANLKKICEVHLQDRYDLEVIDIYQKHALARGEAIIAVPTLIKKLPLPLRRIIGDLSDTERVLFGLDLKPKE
jgi:circadian clock protein KaiB